MPKLKPGDNGFPKPKKAYCFQCQKEIWIKFVLPRQKYSQKNNWGYWAGEPEKKKICDTCLLEFYRNKPLYWNVLEVCFYFLAGLFCLSFLYNCFGKEDFNL